MLKEGGGNKKILAVNPIERCWKLKKKIWNLNQADSDEKMYLR
jgi:hypothetical protein